MSRRSRLKPQVGVSLFPFLAVLICTMGALIVLLLLIMVQARVNAEEIAEKQQPIGPVASAEDDTKLRQQREDADWRRQMLEQQRLAKAEELAAQRLELSHLEDHIRRLEDKWKDLEAQAAQLHSQGDSKLQTREKVAAEIAQIKADIDKTKRELEIARAVAAGKPRSFSIIPYQGPNGTSRRPIYIECTGDYVIIQPEGVALDARDFEGPMGPGNPLDASLRALREYLARNPEMSKYGEPYPLLIVRPDGVVGYAAARAAMKSWEDEFGYELIEDETKLAYPKPDPTLKIILERAIVDARRRQDLLAAAAPSRYRGTATGEGLRASPHGGFQEFMPKDRYGEGDGSGDGLGRGTGAGMGASAGTGNGVGTGSSRTGSRGGAQGQGNGQGQGIGRGGGGAFNPGYAGDSTNPLRNGTGGNGEQNSGKPGVGTSARNFGGGAGGNRNEKLAGGDAGSPTGSPRAGSGQRVGSGGGNGGSGSATGGQAGGGQASTQAGGQSGQSGGGQYSGNEQPSSQSSSSSSQPIASKRGANWGLPNYTAKATGITRPIRVRIEPGEMLILPERGTKNSARIVPIEGSMTKATEELVSQLWDEVEGWGIAVSGGYWKPVLNVEAAPGAEERVAELEKLLDGSGLEVRRKAR